MEDETVVTEHITIEDCIDLDTVDKLVQLLQDLIAELNYAAASNTQLGVERLCGNLQEMKVSTLLFPEQIGHETFYTLGEGALENFQYLEENELTISGSIHSHPSFSAFLSSVDLHMAAQIQKDVRQSLAIVGSSRDGTNPIYK